MVGTQSYKLSICYPIYNRLDSFKYVFNDMINQLIELNSSDIELVVSVNPSELLQDTIIFLENEKKKYDFEVNVNDTNIGIGDNLNKVIGMAHGKFIWVIGDDDLVLYGCVSRVLNIIDQYQDLGWIHLAYARLDAYPNDPDSVVTEINNYQLKPGYYKNGKEKAIETYNIICGNMLFQSVNIYLREMYEKISREVPGSQPQLAATFASAAIGGVYFDSELGVLAGGEVSWKDIKEYELMVTYFKNLYAVVGYGYEKKEVDSMVRYMMSHSYIAFWYRIYKLCLKGTDFAKDTLRMFYKIMPIQTVLTTVFYPFIAIYYKLVIRPLQENKRKKGCSDYIRSDNHDEVVISHMKR